MLGPHDLEDYYDQRDDRAQERRDDVVVALRIPPSWRKGPMPSLFRHWAGKATNR